MTYVRYQGDRYQGWDDFYADMTSVVTPEFFQQLNRYKTFGRYCQPRYCQPPSPVSCTISRPGAGSLYSY